MFKSRTPAFRSHDRKVKLTHFVSIFSFYVIAAIIYLLVSKLSIIAIFIALVAVVTLWSLSFIAAIFLFLGLVAELILWGKEVVSKQIFMTAIMWLLIIGVNMFLMTIALDLAATVKAL